MALAVVWALETFRIYVDGSQTLVHTNHGPYLRIRNNVKKSTRLERWVLRLQAFTFTLLHRPGAANRVADAFYEILLLSETPLVSLQIKH